MASLDGCWELLQPNSSLKQRKTRYHVSHRWLQQSVPLKGAITEAREAWKIVATASVEECLDELVDGRVENIRVPASSRALRTVNNRWDRLLWRARGSVKKNISEEFGPNVKLEPLYPETGVREGFINARKTSEHTTTFTYHGTKAVNIDSISRAGLLMPGKDGHKVANGSAHGVGIYSAKLGSASLSKTFCDSTQMFICAVCDPSKPVEDPTPQNFCRWTPSATQVQTKFPSPAPRHHPPQPSIGKKGGHAVTRRSDEVIHVGDAVVTFEQNYVVPLFLLSWEVETEEGEEGPSSQPQKMRKQRRARTPPATPTARPQELSLKHHAWQPAEAEWALPQQVGRRRLAVPEANSALIKFGGEHDPENGRRGRTVWVAADPFQGRSSWEKTVKYRRMKRRSDVQRRQARQWKEAELNNY